MIFRAIGDVYEIAPPLQLGGVINRTLPPDEMLFFKVRGVNIKEKDTLEMEAELDRARFARDKALEKYNERIYSLVRSKVVEVCNFYVEGPEGPREVKDFDEVCRLAPPEVISWLISTIMSGEALTAAERKNYMRASG